ncbi:hypothetical protein SAMN05443287_104397 [Micromonospora phaseoli]|uniref:Uncharacterized protein n=2 Tax=Micromonospora phaseoli TaxID=1144548 RepID=A0A1H6YRV9_9ACTN|nr:hypothetical protein CLV64_103396 [Micromonospora phaseoli]SEJ44023.1 hypothetical protein SAMN05443287_104397 [Micromonospora phaseoli]
MTLDGMTQLNSTAAATTTPDRRAGPRRHLRHRHLVRHLLEMLLAMVAGMLVLGPARAALGTAFGLAPASPGVGALLMATDMSVGMAVWMWYRGHSVAALGEMVLAMYAPVLLLLVPWAAGLLDADALSTGAHLLMVPAMIAVALRRRHEYTGHPIARPAPRHPLPRVLAHRWPAGLALLMTADNWTSPAPLAAYTLLVLPIGYLVIGSFRRQWGVPGNLRLQLAGLAGWSALALLAVSVGGSAGQWLVAVGWLAHAGWDLYHHRTRQVVPRGYAECCAVIDAVLGITIMLALVTG